MNDPIQALRRLLAASIRRDEQVFDRNTSTEFHAAMNDARAALADIDRAAAAPTDDYHAREAA